MLYKSFGVRFMYKFGDVAYIAWWSITSTLHEAKCLYLSVEFASHNLKSYDSVLADFLPRSIACRGGFL